jgi:hypothetical protein
MGSKKQNSKQIFPECISQQLKNIKPGDSTSERDSLESLLESIRDNCIAGKYLKGLCFEGRTGQGQKYDHHKWILIRKDKKSEKGIYIRFYYTPSYSEATSGSAKINGYDYDKKSNNVHVLKGSKHYSKFFSKFSLVQVESHRDYKGAPHWGVRIGGDENAPGAVRNVEDLILFLCSDEGTKYLKWLD